MTTIAFQSDELCSSCGYLTNPKIGYSTCRCEETVLCTENCGLYCNL